MKHIEITGLDNPKELNDWMSKNIQYDHDNNWTLRSVYEVLTYKKGDCHDQTVYELFYFKKMWKSKYKPKAFFMITPSGSATHSFLTYQEDGKYYWFENAWKKYKGINGPYSNLKELKRDVLSKWCAQYNADPNNTYIGPLVYTTPGASMKDFCTKNVK